MTYIDYNDTSIDDYAPPLDPCLFKRKSFEYESEIRAVTRIFTPEEKEALIHNGIYVPIDIEILVEKVFVSPTSPEWFRELVEAILARYGFDKPVVKSNLYDAPLY